MSPIIRLACVHVSTPSLEASAEFYSRCFGLTVRERTSGAISLAGTSEPYRTLVLARGSEPALTGLEFEASSRDTLSKLADDLADHACDNRLPFPDSGALTLRDPDGTILRIRAFDPAGQVLSGPDRDRPAHLSHLVINSPDASALTAFYVDRLGFTVSDAYERELLTFLRCNQPQHHCLGIAPADTAGLNHFAVDCGDIDALMRSVGRMKQAGYAPIWGPGRHGPGGNVFCYFADPTGLVAEFTCDVLQIADGADWAPRVWDRTPLNGNVWGTGGPSPEAVSLMAGRLPDPPRA